MRKIKTVLLDDDPSCNALLQREAEKFVRLDIKRVFTQPKKFLDFMFEHPEIELVFMDQQMESYQGLDLLGQLPDDLAVVMVTGFENFASKAFTKDVVDFLVKPISYESLAVAVRKVERRMQLSSFWPEMDYNDGSFSATICKKGGKGRFRYNEVAYIQSSKDTSTIYCLNDRRDEVAVRIGRLEADLPPALFKRIHNKTIINKRYVEMFCDGHLTVRFENKEKRLSVGPSHLAEVKEWFNDRLIS